ncbi:dTDP-4-dehydrorhamnose 3,5-epimerase [Colwellia hornerae]|uniref:dTDP-4-dehydrorhamnose 3,5-epimerase n=1 Tax=Colwellia hornerae TaxID=89402 RepID=A0A5C6QJ07_9GAMM|nr:dTDP-4-dehydrorhamnose 3,5-epimerase [Colwellia hornerae]TWX54051.1 dTDP-4-dehydrorhamnose 3,5-epimerase [Colwellia hornerae]TWX60826.1 dTDP-4-dehydrorhamnose 3,5-epimerase [Colwellia hornerae]TWX69156.1 dTDP-4-dehydrorhamnose 3,5-epimerase [Colwellia hornerae]
MIDGVIVTPLKRIFNEKGDILHALKYSEESFSHFGEAYFSTVNMDDVKGWKKHSEMILNLIVPTGAIKFVIYDDRDLSASKGIFQEVVISPENYVRLTIPSKVWLAFQGVGDGVNMLLNIASIEHDPTESVNYDLDEFDYTWD